VVLVEHRGLRAIDPVTAQVRWWHATPVAGHPVASDTTVYVPLAGHRLMAVDRRTGVVNWKIELPGEAVTGIAVSEPIVVVSVVDHRRGRSRLAALSSHDGALRWIRRSDRLFGAPAAVGRVVLAPLGDQVVAFRLHAGTERARLDVPSPAVSRTRAEGAPAYERVTVFGRSLLAGEGTRWVDLRAAIDGEVEDLQRVDDGYGSVFAEFDGLDPGHGYDERLRFWVEFDETSAAPRSAVLLCRRAVLSVRLDPAGHATAGQWAYLADDDREFVAMDVGEHRVTLVREDGRILQLSRRSGVEIDRIEGGEATRGALVLDADAPVDGADQRPDRSRALRMLADVVLDVDPRLLPAQRLVADLMWRDEDPWVRAAVVQLAQADVRSETSEAAAALRRHALDLVAGPWGRPNDDETRELIADLSERPSFLDDRRPEAGVLARRAVRAGDATMLPHLVEHLLHPGTPATDLPEVVAALADLRQREAVEGLATFLRRYHADPQVVFESEALLRAVDVLVVRCSDAEPDEDSELAKIASAALSEIAIDPFTEPSLREYIATRLR
jgi:hypothetical protein